MALSTHSAVNVKASWSQFVGTLLLLLAIIGVVSYWAFVVAYPFGWLAHPETRLATFLVGATLGELTALAVLLQLLHRRNISAQTLGLGKPTDWRGVVLGLVVAFLYIGFTALNPKVGSHLFQLTLLKGLAMAAALMAGLVEETIFRGYLMTSLEALGRGQVTQVLVSGRSLRQHTFTDLSAQLRLSSPLGLPLSWDWRWQSPMW